jgi:hypothetical protein
MRSFVMGLLMLSGCAVGNDCAVNPFDLGQRDGVLGANHSPERYAASCGGAFNGARYTEGYQEGVSRRPPPQGD